MLLAAIPAAIWMYLLFGRGFYWRSTPELAVAQPPSPAPSVTVVVPARDEAGSIARCLGSLLGQDYAGELRVILVDDGSTDGTGAIARAFNDPRLTVLDGAARPAGWSGKLWAVRQGTAAATSEWLLLTDADIEHAPAHLSTLVAGSAERDLVSEMVALNCTSLAERLLVPAFVYFFQMLYPFAWAADPSRRDAAAAGGTMLVRAKALARAGGIDAIRGALIDDVALAGAIKRSGGRIWLGHTRLARSVRPYPGAADIWRMIARTAFVQLRQSPLLLAGCGLGMALTWLAPPLIALLGHGPARWIGVATWVVAGATFCPTLRRFGTGLWTAPLLPAIATFYLAATIGSAVDHWRGRGVAWKGRAYVGASP